MRTHRQLVPGLALLLATTSVAVAGERHDHRANILRVPQRYATIQAAVDAASDGDKIVVSRGRFCGATITRRLVLEGKHGATIVGCEAPVSGAFRIGFLLPDGGASGTSIRGFRFDGRGVSNANLAPLGAGILARSADDVTVLGNHFDGTFQAITNTDGSDWSVLFNRVEHLTALTCDGACAGGDAIVFQQRLVLDRRPRGNVAAFNRVQGDIPDGLNEFSMVGVLVLGQARARVVANLFEIPHHPGAEAQGVGVLVTDHCCAAVEVSTSVKTDVFFNDGRRSELVLRVDPDVNGGPGNLEGARIFGNRGEVELPPEATPLNRLGRLPEAAATMPARQTLLH